MQKAVYRINRALRIGFRFDCQVAGEDTNIYLSLGETAYVDNEPSPSRCLFERYDCLEPWGISVIQFAQKLGICCKQLSVIENYRSRISPEMAIRLDKGFGGDTESWYRLQATFKLA